MKPTGDLFAEVDHSQLLVCECNFFLFFFFNFMSFSKLYIKSKEEIRVFFFFFFLFHFFLVTKAKNSKREGYEWTNMMTVGYKM